MYGQQPIYGQQPGPMVPTKPQKPGPTGVGVAIASGLVPIVCLVLFFVPSLLVPSDMLRTAGVMRDVVGGFLVLLPYLFAAVYLAIAGRGAAGKLIGAGCLLAAGMVQAVVRVVFVFHQLGSDLSSGSATAIGLVNGTLTLTLVVLGWGFARRDGWLWLISWPVALVMYGVWVYGLQPVLVDALVSGLGWKSKTITYVTAPLSMLFVRVVPILAGWGLEALGRRSASSKTGQQYYGQQPVGPQGPPRHY